MDKSVTFRKRVYNLIMKVTNEEERHLFIFYSHNMNKTFQ